MASLNAAPRLRIHEIEFFEWPYTLRLPFRFGVITVTHGRQVVARARIELEDGRSGWGIAAEALGAKWFDKNPAISDDDNLDQLRLALEIARDFYLAHGLDTAFGHFAAAYQPQIEKGAQHRLNPLVASYGPAMIDMTRAKAEQAGGLTARVELSPEPWDPSMMEEGVGADWGLF